MRRRETARRTVRPVRHLTLAALGACAHHAPSTADEPAAYLFAIDGTIAERAARYYLVMKDETFFPSARTIRVASSAHATGPYGPASPPITEKDTDETPRGSRHGSAFLAPRSVLRGLLALDSAATR